MHVLKQLLVLALAGSGLACQCRSFAQGAHDPQATKWACGKANGRIVNAGSPDVQCDKPCHYTFSGKCNEADRMFTKIPSLRSSCSNDIGFCN
ncbi:hypothetical protein EG328_006353 [Venturia inaequalis]|uniref:Uncharacterized protein n=1 Tax=Venturia inaequalis TaxID=5025 RepID=A0A8H3UKE4_VENIN|nr:hypothetical protein EG328_006353 [Venturia inaequalis]